MLLRPLHVEELTLTDAVLSLEGLRLLSGTYLLNLSGIVTADLTPLAGSHELMTLDLSAARLKPTVIDRYLTTLVERYGNRRNCTVILPIAPTGDYREPERDAETGRYHITSGMEAVWVILHEQAWNEGGSWKFIIDNITYTVE